jgi:hypothetical protein
MDNSLEIILALTLLSISSRLQHFSFVILVSCFLVKLEETPVTSHQSLLFFQKVGFFQQSCWNILSNIFDKQNNAPLQRPKILSLNNCLIQTGESRSHARYLTIVSVAAQKHLSGYLTVRARKYADQETEEAIQHGWTSAVDCHTFMYASGMTGWRLSFRVRKLNLRFFTS